MLHGPPGTGKSQLAQIIAEEAGAPHMQIDAAAGSSAFRIAGRRGGVVKPPDR
ncbi:AAA family ATPase [Primorskyibacter sp. S187A]|uniref:AAA family ATPase n=1 Tax=Primorskyibacter sp. S187A TaxID=3415130 RepID=UPI003C7A35F8